MPSPEDIYRELVSDEKRKKGTPYEILVAIVRKSLEQENIVVHDIRLRGEDTGVAHQIDVHIERNGKRERHLIECKDFYLSGDKVGLDIVRNFYGVVDDVKPDRAMIVNSAAFESAIPMPDADTLMTPSQTTGKDLERNHVVQSA